jgi:hypothetical protein
LFEADMYLLDAHEEDRRSQNDTKRLAELSRSLDQFNLWAARAADCTLRN